MTRGRCPRGALVTWGGCLWCVPCSGSRPLCSLQRLMSVNYLGSVYPSRAVIATMKERRVGRVVFVSSQAGQLGLFGYTAYSSSKFAIRGLAEALQMEVRASSLLGDPFQPSGTWFPASL